MDLLKIIMETPGREPSPHYKSRLIGIVLKQSQKMS